MQRPDGLTEAELHAILSGSNLDVDFGVDLLDAQNRFLADLTPDLESGAVERGCHRTIHGTCSLRLSRVLDWGSQRVRPWQRITTSRGSFRVELGVYLLTVPKRVAGEEPVTYDVEGFDQLLVLDTLAGRSYEVTTGTAYLDAARDVAALAGIDAVLVDSSAAGVTLPRPMTWPIDEQTTWLRIINDLLAAVGYRAAWFDWQGQLRFEPNPDFGSRPVEWVYNSADPLTTVSEQVTSQADFTDTPNRWVVIVDDPQAGDGAGAPIVREDSNPSTGPTSIAARGRTITRVERIQAANAAAAEAVLARIKAEDMDVLRHLELSTSPNPLHWHFDVVTVLDDRVGASGRWVVTDWSVPLAGGDVTLKMRGA